MTTPIAPKPGSTYVHFRRQIRGFIVEAQARGDDEARLRDALGAALKSWRAQGYPKSWLSQARADVLKSGNRTGAPQLHTSIEESGM